MVPLHLIQEHVTPQPSTRQLRQSGISEIRKTKNKGKETDREGMNRIGRVLLLAHDVTSPVDEAYRVLPIYRSLLVDLLHDRAAYLVGGLTGGDGSYAMRLSVMKGAPKDCRLVRLLPVLVERPCRSDEIDDVFHSFRERIPSRLSHRRSGFELRPYTVRIGLSVASNEVIVLHHMAKRIPKSRRDGDEVGRPCTDRVEDWLRDLNDSVCEMMQD